MSDEIIYFYNVKDDKYYQSRYTHEYLNNLIKENQELKKQLEDLQETHYLIQGGRSNGKTYLMKLQADKEQLNSLVNSCQEEIRQLKKQLKATEEVVEEHMKKWVTMKNQQKEFIDWLSNTIKEMENTPADDIHQQVEKDSCLTVADTILSKFKEIIEDDK